MQLTEHLLPNSMASAEEALQSRNSKANFQRLTRLLMRGGVTLLRETFDSFQPPANLSTSLSDPAVQTLLRSARLTRPERNCLYPSPGVYGKSTDFDITLTFKLLRTICNLTPPATGWNDLPNSTDLSLEADLARIKYYRNEVYGHSKTMELTDAEFDDLWSKIREALLRIAARKSPEKKEEWEENIDAFKQNAAPLTPEEERCFEELDQWYKKDMDVKDAIETLGATYQEGMAVLQGGLERLQQDFQVLQEDFRLAGKKKNNWSLLLLSFLASDDLSLVNVKNIVAELNSRRSVAEHFFCRYYL